MDPIPQPHILDPDRILDPQRDNFTADHESRAQMYEAGLHESCAYAQQLWQTLDGVRAYLMNSLPPDPRAPDVTVTCASPTGPDDEQGWVRWIDMFSSVTSVMCGPHGDSGYGYGQAREVAQIRRAVTAQPVTAQPVTAQPVTPVPPPSPVTPQVSKTPPEAATTYQRPERPQEDAGSKPNLLRVAAAALVGLLAIRGLLPRHRG